MRGKHLIGLLVLGAFALSGCAPKYATIMRDKGSAEGWTKEQQAVAEHFSYRLKFTTENSDATYSVNYSVLSNELVAKIVKERIEDLESVLDYKNSGWAPYIKAFGLRDELERELKIFKGVHNRLRLIDNYNSFRQQMGQRSSSRPLELDLSYDVSKVFVEDVFGVYPFISERIDEARKNNKLKEVERLLWSANRTYGRKEQDPSDPEDPNKFIWRPEEVGLEFVSYKILDDSNPRDNTIDYIEGTRFKMTSNGIRKESKPALKLFVPERNWPSVLVIDWDKEGEVGFGLPDSVESASSGLVTAESLFATTVINRIFPVSEQEKRIPPKDPLPMVVEIAPVGRTKVDVWEYNDQGWTVPLRYKNDRADNYYAAHKIKDDDLPNFDHSSNNKQVDYFKKDWNGNGAVVEYFRPKAPFDQANLVSLAVSNNRVVAVTKQGEEITGYVTSGSNRVIQDYPYQIDYSENDEKRWRIVDEDGDGKYEKKRQVANR